MPSTIKTKQEYENTSKEEDTSSAQTNFLLPHNKWDQFLLALNGKANYNDKLTNLLKTKGVFG